MTPEAQLLIEATEAMLLRGRMNPYYPSKEAWVKATRENIIFIINQEKLLSLKNAKQDKQQ